jgi:endonuclease G
MRILAALFLVVSFSAHAEVIALANPISSCAKHVPYGQPKARTQDTTVVCRDGYMLEHDNKAHIPIWVAYTLTPETAVGCFPRVSGFQPDPNIRASAIARDYAKSGYDIGHMANDSDMRWSAKAQQESNLFPNAAPQLPGLNRAAWKSLEVRTRSWAVGRKNPILVYVGPIYDTKLDITIGSSRVVVPHAFYKVLVDQKTGDTLAFIYAQTESTEGPDTFLSSLAEVQRQTGVVLPMPKNAKFNKTTWPVTASSIKQKAATCSAG